MSTGSSDAAAATAHWQNAASMPKCGFEARPEHLMMKTYLNELRGQVRGNARLRRKLDEAKRTAVHRGQHIAMLVTLLDRVGLGDHPQTAAAARAIGWGRGK
jgi:hypothetical protein